MTGVKACALPISVNGDAKLITKVESEEQPILGLYIMDYFNNGERASSFFKKQLVGNYIREMDDTGVSTLPLFHTEKIDVTDPESKSTEIGRASCRERVYGLV